MAERGEVYNILLGRISEFAQQAATVGELLTLAEAYAWITNPAQPHGGPSAAQGG